MREHSRHRYLALIDSLCRQGADSVILGCTEIGLLITQADVPQPLFDTTLIHVEAALARALEGDLPHGG